MSRAVQWCGRHWLGAGLAAVLLGVTLLLAVGSAGRGWMLWATPDQQGAWLLRQDRFDRAAERFADPVWRGVALMRAGRFGDAAESFSNGGTAMAIYDRGNALVMLGHYDDAVTQYNRALGLRPGWADAEANKALALARAAQVAHLPGQEAGNEKGADEVYRRDRDRNAASGNESSVMSDEAVRALWLRRVQTKPADFLRARFALQLQQAQGQQNK